MKDKPSSAEDLSPSDEALHLELQLQRQLEDDIARIFDESIYSDIELACGKLKILTHSCILKARTNNFYHTLNAILHLNIERKAFDEVYSFISDVYTECDIQHQESEIIAYLKSYLSKPSVEKSEDNDIFLTPNCVTPYTEKTLKKSISSSPITELTKEYYALVPIENNLLDKELLEQDVLSNAFESIVKSQASGVNKSKIISHSKPTSLFLTSSHTPKQVHSNKCDILKSPIQPSISSQPFINCRENFTNSNEIYKTKEFRKVDPDKIVECSYSPDSLIADDPSSSSDYISAVYTYSPSAGSSGCLPQLNAGDTNTKMENIFTSSDSGLENTGLLESLNSHRDITLTDISLTESTLHDLTIHEPNVSDNRHYHNKVINTSASNSCDRQMSLKSSETSNSKSSKEEKQRQNEEIVILESSSISSETGSWESVFPPKINEKEICEIFIDNERKRSYKPDKFYENHDSACFTDDTSNLVQKSPFKSTSCFIDAASLVDEEDATIEVLTRNNSKLDTNNVNKNKMYSNNISSQPVPCSSIKPDRSPTDWSENNDNEDSLEDTKDPDSIQKDISPTIFEMTPITEDSLCTNVFETTIQKANIEQSKIDIIPSSTKNTIAQTSTIFMSDTPNNSIMSLKSLSLINIETEGSESDTTVASREIPTNLKKLIKYHESSPVMSGGVSVEDHLPQLGSPSIRRKVDNIPIVSGAYVPQDTQTTKMNRKKTRNSSSSWVVDIFSSSESVSVPNTVSMNHETPKDKCVENLKVNINSDNKSRSSVDSDSSERSSHKFYIDLSKLPDPLPAKKDNVEEKSSEKKNIFSMYIELDTNKPHKETPARFVPSSSKKVTRSSQENESIGNKTNSKPCFEISSQQEEIHHFEQIKVINDIETTCNFEKLESLCNNPEMSITEIISLPKKVLKYEKREKNLKENNKKSERDTRSTIGENNINFRTSSSRNVTEEKNKHQLKTAELFVKLSDLDKPAPKIGLLSEKKTIDIRMTRSIPDSNWGEPNQNGSRSIDIISSFHSENAQSLNRLFPNLKNEISRSMPGSLSNRTRSPYRSVATASPGEVEEQPSETSEISSMQSSRSAAESTTEDTSRMSSLIGNCQSRLGQDLLRMFLEEIVPDVTVEVSGRKIKAHKCILSSRCQYFAGILSGGWVESSGNIIVLPPFSYNVVYFALCHIYSGVSTIPDTISILELATLADMLGLEGLKEAIMFTLKVKYCHNFHKPCTVCIAGVLECFPLSSVYGLDDLYHKCLKWITKHFSRVWPTKSFATLPRELLDKCFQQHILNMALDNLIDTVYGCGITVASLASSRWAETVVRMCRRLMNAAAHFAAFRLTGVVRGAGAVALDAPEPALLALQDCIVAALEWAPPDELCRSYNYLTNLLKDLRAHNYSKPDLVSNGNDKPQNLLHLHASNWRTQCERALVRAAPRVVGTQAFKDLPPELRKRLRELGCIMYGASALPPSPLQERKSRSNKPVKIQLTFSNRIQDIDRVRTSFVPYAPKPTVHVGNVDIIKSNNDLRDIRRSTQRPLLPPAVRTTKAQEERAKFNRSKTSSSDGVENRKPSRRGNTFANAKPRYLEPKAPGKKLMPKMVSSSESSRNSSPVLRREKARGGGGGGGGECMSQDSLATGSWSRPRTAEPSTDSLTESHHSDKYATYTKSKRTHVQTAPPVKSQPSTSASINNYGKTKIPMRQNKILPKTEVKKSLTNVIERSQPKQPTRNKSIDKKGSCSLMQSTKSSSAKMVQKTVARETQYSKKSEASKSKTKKRGKEDSKSPDIPIMERSGTFLKDEPMFGETTNIDVAQ